jgi:hypothetical protein
MAENTQRMVFVSYGFVLVQVQVQTIDSSGLVKRKQRNFPVLMMTPGRVGGGGMWPGGYVELPNSQHKNRNIQLGFP